MLSDRQQDGCEPLLAIAEAAGGDWPQRARDALIEILTGEAGEDQSTGVRLLSDLRDIFAQKKDGSLPTLELLSALCDRDPWWSEFSHGKTISAASLGRLLKAYGIHHRKLRVGEATPWGYQRCSFDDAWARYLRPELEHVEQRSNDAGQAQVRHMEQGPVVPVREIVDSSANTRVVPCVPVRGSETKHNRRCYIHGTPKRSWERSPIGSGEWICGDCHPEFQAPTARELGFD